MSWPKAKLGDAADFELGKMLDQKKNKGDLRPYLANLNVRWGEFDFSDLREMRFQAHELDRYGLRAGDIVMCEGGEPGRCAIWKDAIPGIMYQKALHRIRPKGGIDGKFLYYSLTCMGKRGGFSPLFTGATIKHLPRQNLAKVELEIPPISTQNKIAEILSAYDDLIENNRRRIALLEEAAGQLYKEWFVRFRFPGHEHTKIIDGIPEGWKRTTLGDALTLQRGFDLPVKNRVDGIVPIYASTGINGYHNEAKVKGPGIVTGRSGSLGQVQYVHDDFWPLNTALWVKEFKLVDPLFAYFLLSSLKLENYNGGAAVPTLNRNDAHRIEISLPPESLMGLFSEQADVVFQQIKNLYQMIVDLSQARDLLLPKLMSGEIEV